MTTDAPPEPVMTPVAITEDIAGLIASDAPVAIGVSGGKDSQAAALATIRHLDQVGHAGPRILVHSDLGVVEWDESLPVCRRLADHLGLEIVVVRRKAGDLMDRWEARWASSRRRYADLETVTLVLPWSTPAMRFCTSELKTHLIAAELRRRFPGRTVINVTGVRRAESAARAKGAIASPAADGRSWTWRPISDWSEADAFAAVAAAGLDAHGAYALGLSRVSCRFCIMSGAPDLAAATAIAESHDLYRRMVRLEAASTFAFQGSRWLGDVAPQLLGADGLADLAAAKLRGAARVAAERRIGRGMLYVSGWPTRMLTDKEAQTLAEVRATVSDLIGLEARCLTVPTIHARYAKLMAENAARLRRAA